MIEALVKAFPLRVINPPIPFVNSVADLLASSLGSPSSPVRQMSCKVFDVMAEEFDNRKPRFSDPSTHEEAKPGRGV
jgi:hypothetical protein